MCKCCITLKCVSLRDDVDSANTNTRPASREQLEVLISVKEITGALVVKTNATDIVDLSFLRNLRDIHGRNPE